MDFITGTIAPLNIGSVTLQNQFIESNLSDDVAMFTFVLPSADGLINPFIILGISSNEWFGFVFIDSASGGNIAEIFGVDVFDTWKGNLITTGYCTVWSGGTIH